MGDCSWHVCSSFNLYDRIQLLGSISINWDSISTIPETFLSVILIYSGKRVT